MSSTTKYIDITPTWQAAVSLYTAILMDANASYEAKQECVTALMNLAYAVDKHQEGSTE